jgi:dCMP deaminase
MDLSNVIIPSWDILFLRQAYLIASKSKDPRTKFGAVLVSWKDKNILALGYNGFPRGFMDTEKRWKRPTKYSYVVHAEVNSVINAARNGNSTVGSVLYIQGLPCENCAKHVSQAGISEVVVHKQWQDYETKNKTRDRWDESPTYEMFNELNVKIRVIDHILGVQGFLDGNLIEV